VSSTLTRRFVPFLVCISIAAVPAFHRLVVKAQDEKPRTSQQDRTLTPAGKLMTDVSNGLPAIAPLTMNFVRTPDSKGPDGKGRYLLAVNSGWGIQFSNRGRGNQSLSVIDLNRSPEPQIVQNIYFPSPQSANVGLAFDDHAQPDGSYRFYVSGGFENKVWALNYNPALPLPITPKNAPDKPLAAPFIDISSVAATPASPYYNDKLAPVYPVGIALTPGGQILYTANNLDDSLAVITDPTGSKKIDRLSLQRPKSTQFLYPYDVKLMSNAAGVSKVYVSLWGDGTIAVVKPASKNRVSYITVDRHPTLMMLDHAQARLYVVNSDADSVSVIDTATDRVIERIDLRLAETEKKGVTPEGLALSEDEQTLYVTNAHANAVAAIQLSKSPTPKDRSKLLGFIPTGSYPSAIAVVGGRLYIANGKGTGMENSSNIVNETGMYPNMPNSQFPGERYNKQGMHPDPLVMGNISFVSVPDEKHLYSYTQQVMRNNGLLAAEKPSIFPGGRSPFKHVIYIIRENRTYDQVLGDIKNSGDGNDADGDASVAIFGAGKAARTLGDVPQDITPNAHALASRFGLLDRFFVNAEASPDGHNWSTAAFSNDYIDKAFRWNYSRRGRTYDYEGFNRFPSIEPPANQPPANQPPLMKLPVTVNDIAAFTKRYIPYLSGDRDIGEPDTLYLWDAAKRAGLSYRNYGEYVATISAEDVNETNQQKAKKYPDITPTVVAFPTKKSLENHFSPTVRNFDLSTPDIMTTDSYRAAVESKGSIDAAINNDHADARFKGSSRFGDWFKEFRGYVTDLAAGKSDSMPNLSIVRLSNDHTSGVSRSKPTPQFLVADNDYAVGRLVEEVSKSPYWKDTAIFIVEDDAQDGPDHVDAHRSPGLVISAYNRPGALIHEFHSTVSLIRTLELCIGIEPMNFLDSNAIPIDIFTDRADLRPYLATLPTVALDNLFPPAQPNQAMLYYMRLTDRQDLSHNDMADPRELNEIIWFSVRGTEQMPAIARLPAFELMRRGLTPDVEDHQADEDD